MCPCLCKVVGKTVFVDLVHVSVCASASAYTCVQINICNIILCIHSTLSALTVHCSKGPFLIWHRHSGLSQAFSLQPSYSFVGRVQ